METIKKNLAGEQSSDKQIIVQEPQQVNLDIDLWIETRKEFKTKVGSIMLEGSDYHVIQGKKSLAKGGAEKIASIFGWAADFVMDHETLTMIGEPKGILAYVCDLKDKSGRIVGQGRGASSLVKNGNDVNKAVKMAQKSAFIDAVLRASGLSDIYTQDLEDMPHEFATTTPIKSYQSSNSTTYKQNVPHTNTARPATDKQKKFIADLMEQKGYTREDMFAEGFGATSDPTEIIDFLKAAKGKIINGQTVETLPVIQHEYSDRQKKELEEIGNEIKA